MFAMVCRWAQCSPKKVETFFSRKRTKTKSCMQMCAKVGPLIQPTMSMIQVDPRKTNHEKSSLKKKTPTAAHAHRKKSSTKVRLKKSNMPSSHGVLGPTQRMSASFQLEVMCSFAYTHFLQNSVGRATITRNRTIFMYVSVLFTGTVQQSSRRSVGGTDGGQPWSGTRPQSMVFNLGPVPACDDPLKVARRIV